MRQIVINELSTDEAKRVKEFLAANGRAGGVEGLYWLTLSAELLAEAQRGHDACGPFALAIEAGDDFASFELLVRSESNLHCSCTSYATGQQRAFLLAFMDRMVAELGLRA